jgi:hypothetical protein
MTIGRSLLQHGKDRKYHKQNTGLAGGGDFPYLSPVVNWLCVLSGFVLSDQDMKLATDLHLVVRLRYCDVHAVGQQIQQMKDVA